MLINMFRLTVFSFVNAGFNGSPQDAVFTNYFQCLYLSKYRYTEARQAKPL